MFPNCGEYVFLTLIFFRISQCQEGIWTSMKASLSAEALAGGGTVQSAEAVHPEGALKVREGLQLISKWGLKVE